MDIELELGPTKSLIAAVLDRKVEAAFVSGPICQDDLTAVPVLHEELVLVANTKLRSHDEVVAMLASKQEARVLVFKTSCSYRMRLEGFVGAHGLVHVRRMEFGTLDGIIGCVEAGMGISLLPRVVAEPMQLSGRVSIHALPDGAGIAQTLIVYRRDSLLTAAFERFLDCTYELFDLLPKENFKLATVRVGLQAAE